MSQPARENLVGLDLGTTLSVIACIDGTGTAAAVPNREGEALTPSAIYLDGMNAVVGKAAKEAASHYPDKVAMYFKREMGKAAYSRPVDGRHLRPETLSAIVLRKLKQDAERRIGPVSKAVTTVPAFFDDNRRKATEDAGKIAGLEVLDIINEPTAAALAYSMNGKLDSGGLDARPDFPGGNLTALVYDLGGGTFDVTVVQLAAKRFDTLATDGEVELGGKDWDDRIVDFMGEEFKKQYGANPAQDSQRRAALNNLAESIKKLLSQLPSAPAELHYRDNTLDLTLTREQFEKLTANLLTRTEVVTDLVRGQSGREWNQIDRVLLVGGSTRMPMVKAMLRKVTQQEPDDSLDPDQVVARGAAIFAAIHMANSEEGELVIDEEWKKELQDIVIQDVNAHSLGIAAFHPKQGKLVNAVLIRKNTQLPFAASKVFRTKKANARRVVVKVLEGEAREASANIHLGECVVSDLPAGLPERAPVQVRLSYGTNGRVNVSALDMTGGRLARAEMQRQSGMTVEDIAHEYEFVSKLHIQ